MKNLNRAKLRLVLIPLVIILATLACYYRLLLRTESGEFSYIALRWDLKNFTYPRLIFNSDAIRSSIWPLWNPYYFGGAPWNSNFQAGLFHPLSLLIIVLGGYSAEILQLQIIFIFLIAGFSMYFCLRGFNAHPAASLIAAISFLGSGFFVGNASHFPQINTLAVFPLGFMLVHRLTGKPTWSRLCGGALVFSIMIFSGFPTLAFFLAAGSLLFGGLEIFSGGEETSRGRRCLFLLALLILTFALSAVLLFPAGESSAFITRTLELDTSPEIVGERSLSGYNFLSLPFPYLGLKRLSPYRLDRTLRNCSVGLAGLCFSVYYLLFNRRRRKWIVALLLLLNGVFSLGFNTPVYGPAYRWLLPFRLVSHPAFPFRAGLIFFLCLAAGLGADSLLRGPVSEKRKFLLSCLVVLGLSLPLLFLAGKVFKFAAAFLLARNPFWWASWALLVLIMAVKIPGKYFPAAMVILCLVDVSHWAGVNFETVARPAREGEWSGLKEAERKRSREVVHRENLGRKAEFPDFAGAWSMFHKYFSDSGYDGTQLESFRRLIRSPARTLLSRDFRLRPIGEVKLLRDGREVLGEINSGEDPLRVALINLQDIEDEELLRKLKDLGATGTFPGEECRVIRYEPNRIEYEINLSRPAVMFFNEIYYPGWVLKEKGRKIPLFPVNYAFRGAYLGPGPHHLIMEFKPVSFILGLIVTSLAGIFCCLVFIISPLKKRRGRGGGS